MDNRKIPTKTPRCSKAPSKIPEMIGKYKYQLGQLQNTQQSVFQELQNIGAKKDKGSGWVSAKIDDDAGEIGDMDELDRTSNMPKPKGIGQLPTISEDCDLGPNEMDRVNEVRPSEVVVDISNVDQPPKQHSGETHGNVDQRQPPSMAAEPNPNFNGANFHGTFSQHQEEFPNYMICTCLGQQVTYQRQPYYPNQTCGMPGCYGSTIPQQFPGNAPVPVFLNLPDISAGRNRSFNMPHEQRLDCESENPEIIPIFRSRSGNIIDSGEPRGNRMTSGPTVSAGTAPNFYETFNQHQEQFPNLHMGANYAGFNQQAMHEGQPGQNRPFNLPPWANPNYRDVSPEPNGNTQGFYMPQVQAHHPIVTPAYGRIPLQESEANSDSGGTSESSTSATSYESTPSNPSPSYDCEFELGVKYRQGQRSPNGPLADFEWAKSIWERPGEDSPTSTIESGVQSRSQSVYELYSDTDCSNSEWARDIWKHTDESTDGGSTTAAANDSDVSVKSGAKQEEIDSQKFWKLPRGGQTRAQGGVVQKNPNKYSKMASISKQPTNKRNIGGMKLPPGFSEADIPSFTNQPPPKPNAPEPQGSSLPKGFTAAKVEKSDLVKFEIEETDDGILIIIKVKKLGEEK